MALKEIAGEIATVIQSNHDPVRQIILIDGRSGAGKTTFSRFLSSELGAQLVHLEDIYPGWDGLQSASEVVADVLIRNSKWQSWDWELHVPGEWHQISPTEHLIIEGCGALSRASHEYSTFAIWLTCPEELRYERAISRDGELYRPHWGRWSLQEAAFIAQNNPEQLADAVIDIANQDWKLKKPTLSEKVKENGKSHTDS